MQRLLAVLPLLALLFVVPAAAQSPTRTVDYVLGMLHAGMETEAIIAHILEEDIRFRVQAGDISRLRAAGGSDALIEVVVREGVILTGEGEPAAAGETVSHPQRIETAPAEVEEGGSAGEEVAGEAVIVEETEPEEGCSYVETDCYPHGHWSGSFYVGVGWGWWDPWPVYYGPYWIGYWGYPYYPAWGYPYYAYHYPYYYGGRGGYHGYYYARTEPRGSSPPATVPRGVTTVGYPTDPGSGARGGLRGAATVASNDPRGGGRGSGNGSGATDPAVRGRRGTPAISGTARSDDGRSRAMSDDSISGSQRRDMVAGSDVTSRPRRSSVAGNTQFRGQGRSTVSGDTRSSGRSRSSVSGDTRSRGGSRSSVSDGSRSRGRSRSSISGSSRNGGGSRSGMSSRSGRSGGRSSSSMGRSGGGSSYRGASGRGGGGSHGGGGSSRGGGRR